MKRIRLDDPQKRTEQIKIDEKGNQFNGKKVTELKSEELIEWIELLTDLSGYLDSEGKIRLVCKV